MSPYVGPLAAQAIELSSHSCGSLLQRYETDNTSRVRVCVGSGVSPEKASNPATAGMENGRTVVSCGQAAGVLPHVASTFVEFPGLKLGWSDASRPTRKQSLQSASAGDTSSNMHAHYRVLNSLLELGFVVAAHPRNAYLTGQEPDLTQHGDPCRRDVKISWRHSGSVLHTIGGETMARRSP